MSSFKPQGRRRGTTAEIKRVAQIQPFELTDTAPDVLTTVKRAVYNFDLLEVYDNATWTTAIAALTLDIYKTMFRGGNQGRERARYEIYGWDSARLALLLTSLTAQTPAPTRIANASATASSGTLSQVWPTHIANDIGLLFVETANEPCATPSGWTPVVNGSQGVGVAGSATSTGLQVFWKRAMTNAEPAATAADSGDHFLSTIITYRGCITTGIPINISAGDATPDADDTVVTVPGATTTVNRCRIVAAAARHLDDSSALQTGQANASLTGVAEIFDTGTTTLNGGGIGIVHGIKVVAGAYSATTATLSTGGRQARVSLALRPPV